ncbi:MAG TPA: hypothetical protein VFH17_08480 [Coriobacteriia bacterium]|nr:hypothetical protein [Coriobacteriia bacterium]
MATALTLQTIFSAVDRLTGPARTIFGRVDKDAKSATARFRKMADVAAGFLAANVIQRGITKIAEIARESLKLSTDLIEVQNVVDTTFGGMSATINEWANGALQQFGLTELQAKQFSGTMGAMLKSSGLSGDQMVRMSTDLSGLAGDFASFYNLDHEEAFTKIRSGISGETEPLKQLGINMSVANMQAFALARGVRKQWAAMSQSEQTLLRYEYLMEKAADAQGDFAKTSRTSLANQQRLLNSNVLQITSRFLSAFQPLLLAYVTKLNDAIPKLAAWVEANKDLIATRVDEFVKRVGEFAENAWNTYNKLNDTFDGKLIPTIFKVILAWKALRLAIDAAKIAQIAYNTVAGLGAGGAAAKVAGVASGATGTGTALGGAMAAPLLGAGVAMGAGVLPLVTNSKGFFASARSGENMQGGNFITNILSRLAGAGLSINDRLSGRAPMAPAGGGTENISRSAVDVNFNNPPPGTAIRQRGHSPDVNVAVGSAFHRGGLLGRAY